VPAFGLSRIDLHLDKAVVRRYSQAVNATVAQPVKKWTEAELESLPDDGYNHEVVNGQLVMSPKNNFEHGDICVRLVEALSAFVRARRLGVVLDSSTGYWMANRNCRAPDISFIAKERLRGLKRPPKQFFRGAPNLAVEILAPSNTLIEIRERLDDFFNSGTQIAWIIHPDEQYVEVCHSPTQRKIIGPGGCLDGEHLLPGFQFPIADLFTEWDWD
jgi:Uma2 family endonuclease